MSDKKKAELISAAQAASFSTELANLNIKKYLELHGGSGAKFVMKIADDQAHFVMKIADETIAEASEIVRRSAELAAKNLQEFIKKEKGE